MRYNKRDSHEEFFIWDVEVVLATYFTRKKLAFSTALVV